MLAATSFDHAPPGLCRGLIWIIALGPEASGLVSHGDLFAGVAWAEPRDGSAKEAYGRPGDSWRAKTSMFHWMALPDGVCIRTVHE